MVLRSSIHLDAHLIYFPNIFQLGQLQPGLRMMYNIHHPDFLSKEKLAIQWIYGGQLYHMILYIYYHS